jgi:hypothetical protein
MPEERTTCIIGGSSGIAMEVVKGHNNPADCFEKSDRVDGEWVARSRSDLTTRSHQQKRGCRFQQPQVECIARYCFSNQPRTRQRRQ